MCPTSIKQKANKTFCIAELGGPTAYTYRTYVFQVSQGIAALYPPPPQIGPIAAEGRAGGEGMISQLKLPSPLEGIALYGGIAEIVSPIAV